MTWHSTQNNEQQIHPPAADDGAAYLLLLLGKSILAKNERCTMILPKSYITMVSLCGNYAYAIYKTYDKMWSVASNGQVYQSGALWLKFNERVLEEAEREDVPLRGSGIFSFYGWFNVENRKSSLIAFLQFFSNYG